MKSHFLRTAISQSYSYRDTTTDGVNRTTYTFNSVDIGTADTSRLVVVVLCGSGNNSQSGVNPTLTIGDTSATRQVSVFNTAGIPNTDVTALFTLPVSTGTTATIVGTFNAGMARSGISVYALYNLHNNSNPIATGTDTGDESSSSITLNQRYGGIVIYTSESFNNLTPPALPTYTFSTTSLGDTVTYDEITRVGGEIRVQTTGSFRALYTGSNTITLTYDGITREHTTVAASFY